MSEELKSCPFCGSDFLMPLDRSVECVGCGARGPDVWIARPKMRTLIAVTERVPGLPAVQQAVRDVWNTRVGGGNG